MTTLLIGQRIQSSLLGAIARPSDAAPPSATQRPSRRVDNVVTAPLPCPSQTALLCYGAAAAARPAQSPRAVAFMSMPLDAHAAAGAAAGAAGSAVDAACAADTGARLAAGVWGAACSAGAAADSRSARDVAAAALLHARFRAALLGFGAAASSSASRDRMAASALACGLATSG